jgi:uncharacterized protein (DUF4415 family)
MSADWMANDDDDAGWSTTVPVVMEDATPPPELSAPVRTGRPPGSTTSDRKQVALRIPQKVLDHFRAGGPGWQTRMIAVLQREVERSALSAE